MFFKLEDVAIIGSNAFEYSVAIEKTVIEDGNFGFTLRIVSTIDVDLKFMTYRLPFRYSLYMFPF